MKSISTHPYFLMAGSFQVLRFVNDAKYRYKQKKKIY